jgi:hypothetical protein
MTVTSKPQAICDRADFRGRQLPQHRFYSRKERRVGGMPRVAYYDRLINVEQTIANEEPAHIQLLEYAKRAVPQIAFEVRHIRFKEGLKPLTRSFITATSPEPSSSYTPNYFLAPERRNLRLREFFIEPRCLGHLPRHRFARVHHVSNR